MTDMNVVIINGNNEENDIDLFFGPLKEDEKILFFKENEKDIFDLLVLLGAFASKSQARKNWKRSTDIPRGWSDWFIGKKKRRLCILNPISMC